VNDSCTWIVSCFRGDRSKYKEFADLRGHRWAVNDGDSLSGNVSMLSEVKSMGFNANFFGTMLHSGRRIVPRRSLHIMCSHGNVWGE
jgi:hypothetical protein